MRSPSKIASYIGPSGWGCLLSAGGLFHNQKTLEAAASLPLSGPFFGLQSTKEIDLKAFIEILAFHWPLHIFQVWKGKMVEFQVAL